MRGFIRNKKMSPLYIIFEKDFPFEKKKIDKFDADNLIECFSHVGYAACMNGKKAIEIMQKLDIKNCKFIKEFDIQNLYGTFLVVNEKIDKFWIGSNREEIQ